MADEYDDALPIYYGAWDASKFQLVPHLARSNSFGTILYPSPPSQYLSTQLEHSSHYELLESYNSAALAAIFPGGYFLSPIEENHCANINSDSIVRDGLDEEAKIPAPLLFEPSLDLIGEVGTCFWNLDLRRKTIQDVMLPADILAEVIEHGPRASFKYDMGSNCRYADIILPSPVYDSDFNLGSAM
jgi:hypothetical protein